MATICTRSGCGKPIDSTEQCIFHPGGPVFHEGLKSWSCCNDINKPVLEFDQFMALPGCSKADAHSSDKKSVAAPAKPSESAAAAASGTPKTVSTPPTPAITQNSTQAFSAQPASAQAPAPPIEEKEEEDDPSIPVPAGTTCRRKGCGVSFVSDQENRLGDAAGTICVYHPKAPIFHEGSKGYLCCKRRVLEFDEFLKIEGCKTGRHVFAVKKDPNNNAEEKVDCRVDHYQTLTEVHVSVFAKKADGERSTVTITESELSLDLVLPGPKRYTRTIPLFGPVDPEASTFKYYGTKACVLLQVDVILKKSDARSWTVLEKTSAEQLGNFALTFGVGGRTGTIGAKDLVLDSQNAMGRP